MKYVTEHKQTIIIAALVVFIIAEIIIVSVREFGGEPTMQDRVPLGDTLVDEVDEAGVPDFTTDVPSNAVETKADEEVPIVADPNNDQKLGIYTITASRNGYSPAEIVVRQGDIMQFEFTAQGGTYDIFMPAKSLYLIASDGETKHTSFRLPQSGTFRFECRDACPVGEKIYGQLIVKPKD